MYFVKKILRLQEYDKNQKNVPHLWYDKEAKEAAEFYITESL
ncbi:VOC family protein [Neobacillus sp. YIM B02564]|uniref:VOC family protein n=1 Tax=Neobacillus paridis TaxID=2803862 RepID=A0ABS1TP28_9BACI|nr:VOC family protein [Neobacillus paridis]